MRFDLPLFRAINGWPDSLNPIFQLLSEGNKWWWVRALLLFVIVLIAVRGGKPGRKALLMALIAIPLANEACDILKAAFMDQRPCAELSEFIARVKPLTSFGTASSHAANMAAMATVMYAQFRSAGAVWGLVAFLTGISRIYVGVHYPSQVVLGWAVGIAIGLIVIHGYEWISRRFGKPKPDAENGSGHETVLEPEP